jgi:maltose alpha-D-glucosyltransferase/alpha-amylase
MPRVFLAIHLEDRAPIVDTLAETPAIPATCQWALFLRNHDDLTLETVTQAERDYMFLAYTAEAPARVTPGIRRRLSPLLGNDRRRIEVLTALLFSLPGTPIIYYGDEIGMGDNPFLGDRNGVRTPMQWTNDRNAGFSRADPPRLYAPVIMDPVYGYQAVNVEAQLRDPAALVHWLRNMIGLRKLFHVFGRGELEFLQPANKAVLCYVRRRGDETILCVANLSHLVQPVSLDLAQFAGWTPIEMFGYTSFPPVESRPYFLTLGPYGFYWFELQRHD